MGLVDGLPHPKRPVAGYSGHEFRLFGGPWWVTGLQKNQRFGEPFHDQARLRILTGIVKTLCHAKQPATKKDVS